MRKNFFAVALGILIALVIVANAPSAEAVSWTDWSAITTGASGSGTGSMTIGASTVEVKLNGMLNGFSNGDGYFKNYPATYGYLYPFDLIQEWSTGSVTITFSTPVIDPYLALVSVGQSGVGVNYSFTNLTGAINVISSGANNWGYTGYSIVDNTFSGKEFNGVLQLTGTYSSLTFSINPNEYWHGFNIGAASVYTGVPEPATLMLLGMGLIGLAGARRRMKK